MRFAHLPKIDYNKINKISSICGLIRIKLIKEIIKIERREYVFKAKTSCRSVFMAIFCFHDTDFVFELPLPF